MPIKARSGNGRSIRAPETVEQDKRAWELRCLRMTYAQIAAELDIDESTAQRSTMRGARMIPTPDMIEAKKAELALLDRREHHLLGVMVREHIAHSQGRVVIFDGKPVLDDGPSIAANNALDRVQKRRAALLGLDEPARARLEVVTEDAVDAEIRRLELKLGLNGGHERDSDAAISRGR